MKGFVRDLQGARGALRAVPGFIDLGARDADAVTVWLRARAGGRMGSGIEPGCGQFLSLAV